MMDSRDYPEAYLTDELESYGTMNHAIDKAASRIKQLEAENARLKEELAAAQAESKRYRWLRDNECADVRIQHVGKRSWAALDFAIDEAIAKENGK